jgi:hypothetical protein
MVPLSNVRFGQEWINRNVGQEHGTGLGPLVAEPTDLQSREAKKCILWVRMGRVNTCGKVFLFPGPRHSNFTPHGYTCENCRELKWQPTP